MRFAVIAACAAAYLCTPALGADIHNYTVKLSKVRELQIGLMSLERREALCKKAGNDEPCSLPVPTCIGSTKTECLPFEQATIIADDLSTLSKEWEQFQHLVHAIVSDETCERGPDKQCRSEGSGYLPDNSPEKARADFKTFSLSEKMTTMALQPVDIKALEDKGVQVSPTIKAALSPISGPPPSSAAAK